jgi:hypothetical protein
MKRKLDASISGVTTISNIGSCSRVVIKGRLDAGVAHSNGEITMVQCISDINDYSFHSEDSLK